VSRGKESNLHIDFTGYRRGETLQFIGTSRPRDREGF